MTKTSVILLKGSGRNKGALGNQRDENFPMSHVRESSGDECDLRCHQQACSTASVRTISKWVSSVARNTLLMFRADDSEYC